MRDRGAGSRIAAAGAALGATALVAARRRELDLAGRVVLVTGGTRGLGLAIAREVVSQGAQVAVCARDGAEVARAAEELSRPGRPAVGVVCDVRDPEQVAAFVGETVQRLGGLDVVVANAGIIQVGPLEELGNDELADALGVMLWGVWHVARAALPHLEPGGRLAVITSIGGKVAVPHMIPYSVAKFAAVGLSEGLRSELAPRGVHVTTVVPSLMRTGSHVNALFVGDRSAEYTWFSAGAVLPGLAMTAEHAAKRIVTAVRRGDAEVLVGWQSQLAARVHGLAPAVTQRGLELVARVLPDASDDDGGDVPRRGGDVGGGLGVVRRLARPAIARLRQRPEDGDTAATR